MSVQALSVQDAYIYGFALQEQSVPFDDATGAAELARSQAGSLPSEVLESLPNLAEVVGGHIAEVGYDFTTAFEYGLDLILDALEGRRDEA